MFEISTWTALWFLIPLLPIAVWVVWSDLSSMKIPNKAVIATLAIFAVVGLIALPFTEYLWRYAHFAVVIVATFLMTIAGLMGAGDAKFIAAMAPFISRSDAMPFLFLLGAVTIAAFIVHRLMRRSSKLRARTPTWESWERRDFPMGFALAPALIFYLVIGAVT